MAPNREYSRRERCSIIGAKELGVPLTEISVNTGKSYGGVKKTWALRNKRPYDQRDQKRSGRPRKASEEQVNRLYRQLRRNPDFLWAEVIAEFPNGRTQTKARLKEIDPTFRKYLRKKRLDLTKEHAQNRLRCANKHINDPQEQWDNAHWTDECTITQGQGAERTWVFRHSGEGNLPQFFEPTHGSPDSISVWGDMHQGKVCLVFLDDLYTEENRRTNKEVYLAVLEEVIVSGYYEGDLWVQDNASYHTAYAVRDFLEEWNVWVHDHPAVSPDLNLIENFWWHLKRRVFELDPELKTLTGNRAIRRARMRRACERVMDEWNANPQWCLPETLTSSMPRRLRAVQDAQGWQTKY